jgi:protein-L-isoaspartate(D-aspartate) O-methyltransferase
LPARFQAGGPPFSTGGGAGVLALLRAVDKSGVEQQLYYWHMTVEIIKDNMSNPPSDFATARRVMVLSQLRPQGVTDAAVLGAMGAVPREQFLPANLQSVAYSDRPALLDSGAPVLPPAELGQLLTKLAPKAGERALVIGEGGSYSAAVLRQMGLQVETSASGDVAGNDAFDLILVEGAAERIPPALTRHLVPGGRIGAALVEGGVTRLAIGRSDSKAFGFTTFAEAQVPILPGFARARAFTF